MFRLAASLETTVGSFPTTRRSCLPLSQHHRSFFHPSRVKKYIEGSELLRIKTIAHKMSENPFQSDEKLRQLLADVGSIESGEALSNWKLSFLKVYRTYLDPDGVLNARDADGRLIKKLQSLAKVSLKVQSRAQTGHISEAQITADGRRAIGKWTEEMQTVEKAVATFCPKTSKDTDTVGYDKFELGAVLIQDGFQAYEIMLTNRDFIHELRDGPLQGLLDKNTLSIIDFYAREMQSFVDVMSDLGLFKLMTQCVHVYQEEPRPDLKAEPDILTEPVDRDEVVVESSHGQGPDQLGKQAKGRKSKTGGKGGKSTKSPKANGKSTPGDEEAMPTKKKEEAVEQPPPPPSEGEGGEGDKIIYFDPKTGNIGLLMRDKCAEDQSELMFTKDDKGELQNNGAINSPGEKENLVWLLKKLEKQKPKDGAWLEEIKKEKAARKAAEAKDGSTPKRTSSVRVKKEPAVGSTPSKPVTKTPVRELSSGRKSASSSPKGGSGFKNPLEQAPPPKKSDSTRRKSAVHDYQGMYKQVAPKPKADGWEKVKPEQVKLDEAAQ